VPEGVGVERLSLLEEHPGCALSCIIAQTIPPRCHYRGNIAIS